MLKILFFSFILLLGAEAFEIKSPSILDSKKLLTQNSPDNWGSNPFEKEKQNSQDFQGVKKIEFIISYKLYTKNEVAKGDRYRISQPIQSRIFSGGYTFDYQCRIDSYIADFLGDDSQIDMIKIILEAKKDAVLECLYKSGVEIRDDSFSNHSELMSKATLTLPAKSVLAYLDNSYLILEVWRKK